MKCPKTIWTQWNIRILPTCDSYGRKATLISFKVLINFETLALPISAKRGSGQAKQGKKKKKKELMSVLAFYTEVWEKKIHFSYL